MKTHEFLSSSFLSSPRRSDVGGCHLCQVGCLFSVAAAVQSSAPANTDTLVSVPLRRPAIYVGRVEAVNGAVISVSGSPNWTPASWALQAGPAPHYLRVLSGALGGHAFTVINNNANALIVDAAGLDLTKIVPGDRIELAPYWTLGTLYPASQAGVSYTFSFSSLGRGTEIMMPDQTRTGINRAPSDTFYFFNGAWRRVGSPITLSFDRTVIPPDTYVLQRNKSAGTTLTRSGWVFQGPIATIIEGAAIPNDNYVALAFPEPVSFRLSNLVQSGAFTSGDQLLVFGSGQTGINRAPSATYVYGDGAWRQVGATGEQSSDGNLLPVGEGFIVRKAAGAASATWTFVPPAP